jgi:hypothetical protein
VHGQDLNCGGQWATNAVSGREQSEKFVLAFGNGELVLPRQTEAIFFDLFDQFAPATSPKSLPTSTEKLPCMPLAATHEGIRSAI